MFQVYLVYEPFEWTATSNPPMDALVVKENDTYRWMANGTLFIPRELTSQLAKTFGYKDQSLEELMLSMVSTSSSTVIHETEHVLYLGTFENVDEFVNRMNLFNHMGLFNKGMRDAFLTFVYETRHKQPDSV